jgi:lysozyme family protein
VIEYRLAFLQRLPTWGTFGKGWTKRVKDVQSVAMEMAA